MSAPGAGGKLAESLAVPAALAASSAVGLVVALLGDGVYDVIAWLAAGAPTAIIAWAIVKRRQ